MLFSWVDQTFLLLNIRHQDRTHLIWKTQKFQDETFLLFKPCTGRRRLLRLGRSFVNKWLSSGGRTVFSNIFKDFECDLNRGCKPAPNWSRSSKSLYIFDGSPTSCVNAIIAATATTTPIHTSMLLDTRFRTSYLSKILF